MTNLKTIKRALFSSVIALLVCFTMLIGTTFAWFTDSVTSNSNVIQTGTLKVGMYWAEGDEAVPAIDGDGWENASTGAIFNSTLWEPAYAEAKHIKIVNEGTLALKYKLVIAPNGEVSKLADVIDVYYIDGAMQVTREMLANAESVGTLREMIEDPDGAAYGYLLAEDENTEALESVQTVTIALKMKESAGNEYNDLSIGTDFALQLLVTQYAYEEDGFNNEYDSGAEYPVMPDTWDGTVDTSWYDETATTFSLTSSEQLAGLAKLVDEGNSFAGKTVKLDADMNLASNTSFDPIGDDSPFEGVFDGQGHTISNMSQSGWDFGYEWGSYGSIGLFGEVKDATVKNLTVSGFDACVEGGDIGGITGSASGNCVFENITVQDSDFGTYNNGIGGIIGWSGEGNYTFKNITIAEDVVLGGLWGSFDSSIGGIVGQGEPGATYHFENVNIACRLDAYNDCTASYDYYNYRMCGMIIGRLAETVAIDGVNYPDTSKYNITCNNVAVVYGEWANYHYCRAEGARAVRVEAGYEYGGIASDYDHTLCEANEHHMMLIEFDQIFGGDQYGVKGIKEYEGVTVIYNNK